jgi:hypothetical protein
MNYSSTQGLASLGRNGDSMLVHMSPSEVAGLQGLAMAQGGSLTINPNTGLPEAFSLGGFFKSLLPTIVGGAASLIPGMQFASYPMLTGILAGAATGALTNKNKLLGAVTGGLGGYSGAGIMGAGKAAAGAMGSAEAAKTAATNAGIGGGSSGLTTGGGFIPGATSGADLAYNNALLSSQGAGITNSAVSGASGAMDVDKLLAAGKPIGMANTVASTASLPPDPTFLGNVGSAFKGIGGAATGNQAAIDAYTKGIGAESTLGALGKTALPFGGAAVMGGLEASDLYGEPLQRAEAEKYNPYARLNLGSDTGLRLVAKGGYIDGYATGGTIQSGGIRDLYGTPDNQPTISPGLSGFGLGRLNNLAGEQAMTQAQTLGYAEGGVASLELPDPSKTVSAPENLENMILNETAKTEMLENQLNNMTSNALNTGNIPTQNYAPGALSNVAAGMQNQSVPPQASFVQNLTSARTGYAEGGETSMNLDQLPTLNVNLAGKPSANASSRDTSMGFPSNNSIKNILSKSIEDILRDVGRPRNYDPAEYAAMSPVERMATIALGPITSPFDRMRLSSGAPPEPKSYALNLNSGKQEAQYARGGYLDGQGDGMSDSIPATIEGKQPARLADGEFVIPADVVSHLGNGSTKAGSKRLYAMLDKVRKARTGTKKQGKQINPAKYMPA